jgi:hypothetical protein
MEALMKRTHGSHHFIETGGGALPKAPGQRKSKGRFFKTPEEMQTEAILRVMLEKSIPVARCEICETTYPLEDTRTVMLANFVEERACRWCTTAVQAV